MNGPQIINAPKVRTPVAGIRQLSGPTASGSGIFRLPPSFDTNKHVAQWAEEGPEAEFLTTPQTLVGLNLEADGWAVWKDPKSGEVRRVGTRAGKRFILMFRDKELQKEINALYGDKSKADIYKVQTGESVPTVEGIRPGLSGMLTAADLKGVDGGSEEDDPTSPEMSAKSSGSAPVTQKQSTRQRT